MSLTWLLVAVLTGWALLASLLCWLINNLPPEPLVYRLASAVLPLVHALLAADVVVRRGLARVPRLRVVRPPAPAAPSPAWSRDRARTHHHTGGTRV